VTLTQHKYTYTADGLTKKSCIAKIALVLKGSSCGKPG